MTVQENLNLIAMRHHHRLAFMQDRKLRRMAAEAVKNLSVRTPHLDQEIRFLSGGNQQKVVFGKWLSTAPKILILDEPTRGIDVGAKAEIYEMMQGLAGQGTAIVMVSSELPELLANCDRVIVMAEGRIAGQLDRAEATEDAIMALCHLPNMEAAL
jgi:ABC-type sugar transport system ATPase subunit